MPQAARTAADAVTEQHSDDLLELVGQPALSDFRLAKLLQVLKRRDERVTKLEARFVYFANLSTPLDQEAQTRLNNLLLSGEAPGRFARDAQTIIVVPRPGTISPWSSKATDICSGMPA